MKTGTLDKFRYTKKGMEDVQKSFNDFMGRKTMTKKNFIAPGQNPETVTLPHACWTNVLCAIGSTMENLEGTVDIEDYEGEDDPDYITMKAYEEVHKEIRQQLKRK